MSERDAMTGIFGKANILAFASALLIAVGGFSTVRADDLHDQALYAQYTQEGIQALHNNHTDQAIRLLEKAVPLTRTQPKPALYNNLAIAYTRRSIINSKQDNLPAALSDARMSYFYAHYVMRYAYTVFPRQLTPFLMGSEIGAKENLLQLYAAAKVDAKSGDFHLLEAQTMEKKGEIPQALVEYGLAAENGQTQASVAVERLAQELDLWRALKTEAYHAALAQKMKSLWRPSIKPNSYEVFATFNIQRDGKITDAAIKKSSGDAEADQTALKVLNEATLDPPPKFLLLKGKNYVPVEFTFDYQHKKKDGSLKTVPSKP